MTTPTPKGAYASGRRLARQVRIWVRDGRWRLFCADCGQRFWPGQSVHGYGGQQDKFHERCMSYLHWRRKADERLDVLDLVSEVWEVTSSDVRELLSGRADDKANHKAEAWNKGWRVFYDLDNARKARAALTAKADSAAVEP